MRVCEKSDGFLFKLREMLRKHTKIRNKLVEAGNREDETETEKSIF